MKENENPYTAPQSYRDADDSIWTRIRKFFFGARFWLEPGIREQLLTGTPVFQYGVLFFVDSEDKHLIHAALPMLEISDTAKKLNVEEAKRELRNLVENNRELEDELSDRMLSVRFVVDYRNIEDQVCDPVVTSWRESKPDQISV